MFVLSATVYEIFGVEICMTSCEFVIALSVLYVNVYEIVTINICMTLTSTFRLGLGEI